MMLELRMAILDEYVDFFVICESNQTFSGKPKPIYYQGNNPKVIHIIAPNIETSSAFERAAHQKDFIRTALVNCKPDDRIYYGDVDEIWTPQTQEGKLRQICYSYYLNNRSSEDWVGTNTCLYKNIKNLVDLRADRSNIIDNGGWHFTNMGGKDAILRKLESYDHQEYNTDEIKDTIETRMQLNEDYVGRETDYQGKEFTFWIDEVDLPKHLIYNREKYEQYFKKS
jgi:beta-1,4-mannosyl-glycoprotein beta-1,4-N-acetylglucosaminyltransferase